MLGIVFSLLAAATFALNAAAARRAVLSGTVIQGLMITVPLGVPLFLILSFAVGDLHKVTEFPLAAYFWFACAGIVHFVLGRYCNYAAGAAIGTNLTTPVLQGEVLVTLVLAIVVLGEYLTPMRVLGITLILLAPSLIRVPDSRPAVPPAAGAAAAQPADPASPAKVPFQPRYLEGYIAATSAAFFYGLSPVCIGLGLKAAGGTGAIAGGFVSYCAAAILVGILLVVTGPPAGTFRLDHRALRWFLLAGFMVFLSHVFRYAAMMFVPASIMTTLQRLSSLFRIYFSWAINRDHEVFDGGVISATVVSTIGAIALAISTDMFLSLAQWPDWVVRIARWRWP